jgi:hypothetical protein
MNHQVLENAGNLLTSWEPVSFSRTTLLHGVSKYSTKLSISLQTQATEFSVVKLRKFYRSVYESVCCSRSCICTECVTQITVRTGSDTLVCFQYLSNVLIAWCSSKYTGLYLCLNYKKN